MFRFVVLGNPVPQPRHRVPRFGKPYIEDKHPIHAYRLAIQCAAVAQSAGRKITGWVSVDVIAAFARPKSHWLVGGLKADAPELPPKADVDNVAKGILDALTTSRIWDDDAQVAELRIEKRYAARGESGCTWITLKPARRQEAATDEAGR
jgi:Holliday junction resolvase RusA-like endonuclease